MSNLELRPYTVTCFFEYAYFVRVAYSLDDLNRATEYLRGFIAGVGATLCLEPVQRDRMFSVLFNAADLRRAELSGGAV